MKKQLIIAVSVLLAALLAFGIWFFFFKGSDIQTETDPFFTLSETVLAKTNEFTGSAVITLCSADETIAASDERIGTVYRYAKLFNKENGRIKVEFSKNDGFSGVKITQSNGSTDIVYDDFYKKLYDGTVYAFDGESLLANAIFGKLDGIALRALDGYDTDGDTIVPTTNRPFMFVAVDKKDVSSLIVKNDNGAYGFYQADDGSFKLLGGELLSYSDELFAQLIVNCRYPLSAGKLAERLDWSEYKLDSIGNAVATYVLQTVKAADGSYLEHTVYIGSYTPDKSCCYARYIGVLHNADGSETKLDKDFVYLLPASDMEASLFTPVEKLLTANLVYGVSQTTDTNNYELMQIEYLKQNLSMTIKNFAQYTFPDNIAAYTTDINTTVADKISFKGDYSGKWTDNTTVFAGFTTTDGKSANIDVALTYYAQNGQYKVELGLLRDEANMAFLPPEVKVLVSYDGTNFESLENGIITPSQADKTIKKYSLEFTSEKHVLFVKLSFSIPKSRGYIVTDDIRVYADKADALPNDGVVGTYRILSPSDYIPDGRNFAYADTTNFSAFTYGIGTLVGDSVVEFGISENGDASKIDREKLKKYGLDEPDKHFAYVIAGYRSDVYISAPNADGNYYAYSIITGDSDGKTLALCTDIIAEISPVTAEWMSYDMVDYIDHAIISMYYYDILDMTVTKDKVDYKFTLNYSAPKELIDVTYTAKDGSNTKLTTENFKYFYLSVVSVNMRDEYIPSEGDNPVEYLRVSIHGKSKDTELVFYRVSASKAYFTIDGSGSYFTLIDSVANTVEKLNQFVSGGTVSKK